MCEWGNYMLSEWIQGNVGLRTWQETEKMKEMMTGRAEQWKEIEKHIKRETYKERDAVWRGEMKRQTAAWPFDSYPKAKSKPSMPSGKRWRMRKGRQTWAASESTARRANCPVLLTDGSLMKRELCSSQMQTKKPNFTEIKCRCLTVPHWQLLISETSDFYKDVGNVF